MILCDAPYPQVRLFSARDHIRALGAGDVWAVVGWSQELTLVGERSNATEVVVPRSGTALFADLWAVPKGASGGHMQSGPSPLLPSWMEFGLSPARAAGLPGLKTGAWLCLLSVTSSSHIFYGCDSFGLFSGASRRQRS